MVNGFMTLKIIKIKQNKWVVYGLICTFAVRHLSYAYSKIHCLRQKKGEKKKNGMNYQMSVTSNLHLNFPFLDHCWMESNQTIPEQLSEHNTQSCEERDVGGSSFSASFMSRNQDISFGTGSPICDAQSPTFTCRSSFSSFLGEPVTPCLVSGGFSFQSMGDSPGLEFASPVPSMLSFSFLSPSSVVEQKSCKLEGSNNMSDVNAIARGMCGVFHFNCLYICTAP